MLYYDFREGKEVDDIILHDCKKRTSRVEYCPPPFQVDLAVAMWSSFLPQAVIAKVGRCLRSFKWNLITCRGCLLHLSASSWWSSPFRLMIFLHTCLHQKALLGIVLGFIISLFIILILSLPLTTTTVFPQNMAGQSWDRENVSSQTQARLIFLEMHSKLQWQAENRTSFPFRCPTSQEKLSSPLISAPFAKRLFTWLMG